jgi:hypothetical protein
MTAYKKAVRLELQDDKDEKEEINNRKANIIIHGLSESSDKDINTKKICDEEIIMDLLHIIKLDDVSVRDIVRLGRFESESAIPRPVKLVVAIESQKESLEVNKKLDRTKCSCTKI